MTHRHTYVLLKASEETLKRHLMTEGGGKLYENHGKGKHDG